MMWTDWKTTRAARALVTQYVDDGVTYYVFGYDGPQVFSSTIWKGTLPDSIVAGGYSQDQNDADKTDFEANYKATANQPIDPRTIDGRQTMRLSVTNRTVSYIRRVWSFYTAKANSLVNNNPATKASWGDVTMYWLDSNGNQTQDPTQAAQTILDWDAAYSFEVVAGSIDVDSTLRDGASDQWYAAAVGAPDYPPQAFGSIPFICDMNLEAVSDVLSICDGRSVQLMAHNYMGAPHTNRIRFIFKHPVGAQKRFQVHVDHYV